jgi:hypothetical protein
MGKRIVLLQPIKVVKGDQNGYLVPGGIAGPLCPEGYKYGGLALQVGVWAVGSQSAHVKKLTVWKPIFWPRKNGHINRKYSKTKVSHYLIIILREVD